MSPIREAFSKLFLCQSSIILDKKNLSLVSLIQTQCQWEQNTDSKFIVFKKQAMTMKYQKIKCGLMVASSEYNSLWSRSIE